MEERRRYFRINDQIIVVYEVIDYETFLDAGRKLQHGEVSQDKQLQALYQLDRDIQYKIKQLKDVAADFAEVLQLLNNKINLISHTLPQAAQETPDISGEPLQEVNLSGSGMALYLPESLALGQHLYLHLLLPDSFQDIFCYGTVVRSDWRAERGYMIGVDFTYILEEQREAIIKHVIRRQTEQLRARRAAQQASD